MYFKSFTCCFVLMLLYIFPASTLPIVEAEDEPEVADPTVITQSETGEVGKISRKRNVPGILTNPLTIGALAGAGTGFLYDKTMNKDQDKESRSFFQNPAVIAGFTGLAGAFIANKAMDHFDQDRRYSPPPEAPRYR